MEALLVSTVVVAIAEIGDKTQLLALLLAARYRVFWPLAAGITVATVANHAVAAAVGVWVSDRLPEHVLRWLLAASFIAVALWTLKPDTLDDEGVAKPTRHGAFWTTTVAFFLAEMGDKTQIATVLMAARFDSLLLVVIGSTVGMLLANLPVVALGAKFATRLPLTWARWAASALFVAMAAWVVASASGAG